MKSLYARTLKLAKDNPELREILVPVLKESRFEKGVSVPLSELPEELQENVRNPPPGVLALKEKMVDSKKAADRELRKATIKLAHEKPALRKHLLPLLKKKASEQHRLTDTNIFWPETPRGWEESIDKVTGIDRDLVQQITFLSKIEGLDLEVEVVVDATDFVNSDGKKPGKFEVISFGTTTKKGKWKDPKNIAALLNNVRASFPKKKEKFMRDLKSLGGGDWNIQFDGGDLNATYIGEELSSEGTELYESLQVTFDFITSALSQGNKEEAVISFAEGADYDGAYGVFRKTVPYTTKADIEKILNNAVKMVQKG